MRIHHFTVPAHDPAHVAAVLAEVLGAHVTPMPHPHGALFVYADDADGTLLEVWPSTLRAGASDQALSSRDLPLPEAWPHHAFVTSDATDPDAVVAAFRKEGWRVAKVHNGPEGGGFDLVRGFIENHTQIEIGGRQMRAQYERTFAELRAFLARQRAQDAHDQDIHERETAPF